jgi:predicted adenylyl cyclase CyaB
VSLEIEIKLPVASHEPLRRRLEALGATRRSAGVQTDRIFDRPDGELRRRGVALRIRSFQPDGGADPQVTLTVKGPAKAGGVKIREEIEQTLDDADRAVAMLNLLGFETTLTFQNHRESWPYRDCEVALDRVPYLGCFVEIEGPSEERVLAIRRELNLEPIAHRPSSYAKMLVEYCETHGIADRTLLLPADTGSGGASGTKPP